MVNALSLCVCVCPCSPVTPFLFLRQLFTHGLYETRLGRPETEPSWRNPNDAYSVECLSTPGGLVNPWQLLRPPTN